jgi:hypothetical protein
MTSVPTVDVAESADAQQNTDATAPPRPADPHAVAWCNRLVGRATHLAIGVLLPNGSKAFYPTEISNEADRQALIEAHLAGRLPPRLCLRQGERFLVERPFGLGYFTTQRDGDSFVASAITCDIDGPGHADGLTAEQVEERTWAIVDVAEEAGLVPAVVRSNSAKGRHIIISFSEPIAAGLAVFIAQGLIDLVPGAAKTELFPRTATLRDGQFGRLVALPLNGAAPAPGGGRIIDRAGKELPASSVRIPTLDAVAVFSEAYLHHHAAEQSLKAAHAAEGAMLAHLAHASSGDQSWSQATLEQVVRAFAEIVDDREREPDVIGIRCPTHDGSCFHVNVDAGWFACHACLHKGGGPGAPYMLLKLLRPEWSHTQVRAELKALHLQAAAQTGVPS